MPYYRNERQCLLFPTPWGILAELVPSSVKFGIHSGTLTVCWARKFHEISPFLINHVSLNRQWLPVNGQITKRTQKDDIQLYILYMSLLTSLFPPIQSQY